MALTKQERADAQKSLVGFVVGDIAYAVPIAHVREIVNPIPLSQLPHAPAAVAGVADHRGEVVPIVDLRIRFGLPPTRDARKCKWILIEVEGRGVGLIVDRVTGVFGKTGGDIRAAPTLGAGDDVRGISGVTTHDGMLTFVLDTAEFEVLTRPVPAQLLTGSLGGMP
ncbi:MAG TPA: chemotaxis protein CheW [Polyangiaceae bacterium]|jgi:purine-binding chemotaxis protein CheW